MFIIIHRSDYRQDSNGMDYFHHILDQARIPEDEWEDIETIDLEVTGITAHHSSDE